MKIHRFIGSFNFKGKEIVIRDSSLVHQIGRVLRLRAGEQIILGDGQGTEKNGLIKKVSSGEVVVRLDSKVTQKKNLSVALYMAILKKENFEWVAQKATEIGVSEIIPVITERTIKLNINTERLEKILKEAAEQSGQITIPKLLPSMSFEEALDDSQRFGSQWLFDEAGKEFKTQRRSANSVACFVGPEGGWSSQEKDEAKKKGFSILSVGSSTLRAETAAVISSYLAASFLRSKRT